MTTSGEEVTVTAHGTGEGRNPIIFEGIRAVLRDRPEWEAKKYMTVVTEKDLELWRKKYRISDEAKLGVLFLRIGHVIRQWVT